MGALSSAATRSMTVSGAKQREQGNIKENNNNTNNLPAVLVIPVIACLHEVY